MAVTFVGQTDQAPPASTSDVLTSVTLDTPAGVIDDDLLVAVFSLPRAAFYRSTTGQLEPLRTYSIITPPGWRFAVQDTSNDFTRVRRGLLIALYRVASNEPDSTTFDISLVRTAFDDDAFDPISVSGVMLAYRGAATSRPLELAATGDAYYSSGSGGGGGNVATPPTMPGEGLFVQVIAGHVDAESGDPGASLTIDEAGTTTRSSVTGADVTAAGSYDEDGLEVNAFVRSTGVTAADAAAAEGDTIPGLWSFTASPALDARTTVRLAILDASAVDTDAPPTPGWPGVAGSGSLTPEPEITSPLLTEIYAASPGGLSLASDEDSGPQAFAAELLYGPLGTCAGGALWFGTDPGLSPFGQLVALKLDATSVSGARIWRGVVQSQAFDRGAYRVDLLALWEVLGGAQVTTTEDPPGEFTVDTPSLAGFTSGALVLNAGGLPELEVGTADEFQSWDEYLARVFDLYPDAQWGVGPDLTYVQGRPQDGGVVDLSASSDRVLSVKPTGHAFPDYATAWWAETSGGALLSASRSVDLLVPRRLERGTVNSAGELVAPAGANRPAFAGPTYEVVYQGLAVPPVRVTDLPIVGSQYAAGARVQVTPGEDDQVPSVTTTLTTVALPYANATRR